jgi:hypothetical protein
MRFARILRRTPLAVPVAVALAVVAVLAVHGSFERPFTWTPDGLFYQARVLQLRGESHDAAFRYVQEGPISERLRRVDPEHSGDPAWMAYNERFFERRVAVPLVAAALHPAAGDRALLYVSVAGYVAAVLAVFMLLLMRFPLPVAAVVALATALFPALSDNAPLPHTDTWGVALLAFALAAALRVLDRGLRWLPVWMAAIFVLAFTRDSTWVAILAAGWCAWRLRSRTGAWVAVAGVAAALPAALLFPVPLRELLAFGVSGLEPAPDASWSLIAQRFPETVLELLRSNAGFIRGGEWLSGAYLAAGLALLFALGRRRPPDAGATLLRGAALAAAPYLLVVPVFSGLRLELVFVPAAAFGLALGVQAVAARAFARAARARLARGGVVPNLPARQPMGTP